MTTQGKDLASAEGLIDDDKRKKLRFGVKSKKDTSINSNNDTATIKNISSSAESAAMVIDVDPKKKLKSRSILILAIVFAAIGLVIAVIAFLIVTFSGKPQEALETAPQILARAAQQMSAQEYDKAKTEFDAVLKMPQADTKYMAEAYLGNADIYLLRDNPEQAILTLQTGLKATDSQTIKTKLDELTLAQKEPAAETNELTEALSSLTEDESSIPAIAGEDSAATESAIVWKDPAFEKMIREGLKLDAENPVYPSDLKRVERIKILGNSHVSINSSINSTNKLNSYIVDDVEYFDTGSIKSLEDLSYFENLTWLVVGYNQISSLDGIQNLEKLKVLGIYCNNISDISEVAQLENLEFAFLYNNNITDISPLASLKSLSTLWLNNNHISDISALSGVVSLKELYVNSNKIESIAGFSKLTSLKFLYAENNNIKDISEVAKMLSLTDISFVGNPVANYSFASNVVNVNRSMVIPYTGW